MTGRRPRNQVGVDRALVLRRYRYGESSLVVHLLARNRGRVHLMAKGAYRPKSAFSGVIDLFDTLELSWRETQSSDLCLLTKADIRRRRAKITGSLASYRAALSVLDVAGLGAREGHEEHELFDLVEVILDRLVTTGRRPAAAPEVGRGSKIGLDPELLGAVFELRFLALQGLAPALAHCASCGDRVPDPAGANPGVNFSIAEGGRLCDRCASALPGHVERQPLGVLRVARSLLETPIHQLDRIQLDSERSRRLRFFVRHFLEYHLETRPRSFGPTRSASVP